MPRPEFNGAGVHQSNPIKAFFEGRKSRREKLAETAAKEISNDTAKNELRIADTLGSVDFIHSRIKPEILNEKTDPKQPCGDLEWASRAIRRNLLDNPQPKSIDIRKIDEKILQLAVLFKQSVEQGDKNAAYAAKAALARGIHDIRNRVPADSAPLSAAFVETNAKYLESWITLVMMCQCSDRLKENADNEEALYNSTEEKLQKGIDDFYNEIQDNPEVAEIFAEMIRLDEEGKRSEWTRQQVDLHNNMIERAIDKSNLILRKISYIQLNEQYTANEGRVDVLYSKLAMLPIVTDPNLMNKFQEELDALVLDMAKADQEIDETLTTMDKIVGALDQLEHAPGAIRAKEVALETTNDALEEIKRMQELDAGIVKEKADDRLRSLGIKSREEVEILKKQAEEAHEREMQEMFNALQNSEENTQSEGQVLYN